VLVLPIIITPELHIRILHFQEPNSLSISTSNDKTQTLFVANFQPLGLYPGVKTDNTVGKRDFIFFFPSIINH
jgi:hypothetical protein